MGNRGFGNEELVTARLSLRRPTPADIDLIHDVHSDPRACAHNPADMLSTRAEAEDRYQRWDVHWQRHGRPEHPVIARVRPENTGSQRVAVRAGLHRAEHLDSQGEDGLDWIFTSHRP